MSIAFEAMMLARNLHEGHLKNNIEHLSEVAGIMATIVTAIDFDETDPNVVIATAWLHESISYFSVTPEELRIKLYARGCTPPQIEQVVTAVTQLTCPKNDAPLKDNKAKHMSELAAAPGWVQTIQVVDYISNARTIISKYPGISYLYFDEMRQLVQLCTNADPAVLRMANEYL